jgi:hypothetical protein
MFWDAWSKNRTFADTQDLDDIEPEMQATSFPMVINGIPARANGMLASSYPMKLEQSLHSVARQLNGTQPYCAATPQRCLPSPMVWACTSIVKKDSDLSDTNIPICMPLCKSGWIGPAQIARRALPTASSHRYPLRIGGTSLAIA